MTLTLGKNSLAYFTIRRKTYLIKLIEAHVQYTLTKVALDLHVIQIHTLLIIVLCKRVMRYSLSLILTVLPELMVTPSQYKQIGLFFQYSLCFRLRVQVYLIRVFGKQYCSGAIA